VYVSTRRRVGSCRPRWVSAEPARAALKRFRARGIGTRRLAELAGISQRTVQEVLSGSRARIRPSVETRIVTLKPSLAGGALISSWNANRALQAMAAEGYEREFLMTKAPIAGRQLGPIVRVSTERTLVGLYRRLTL
jgi:hypothetical protein